MTRVWIAGTTALAIAGAVALSAQTSSAPQSTPQTTPTRQDAAKPITATGCLMSEPVRTTAPSSQTAASAPMQWVLTSATTSNGAAATGTSGTAGAGAGSRYLIMGNEADLAKHKGHKIEVTGTMMSMPATGATSSTATPPVASGSAPETGNSTSARAAATAGGAEQHLQVTAIKMLAATCP